MNEEPAIPSGDADTRPESRQAPASGEGGPASPTPDDSSLAPAVEVTEAPAAAADSTEPERPVAVKIRGLTKVYGGKVALDHLDLDIHRGDIFGYIGPNGAGKTTTIRILSALLWPSSGKAWVEGVDVVQNPFRIKELVGYMPDAFGVYDNMTLYEYLDFFGAAYRIPRARRKQVIEDVLELTDLGPKRKDQVSAFSRGMKQRACLAKTLLHDPRVLILDEPASGLDPRARIEFRELLKELQRMGKTIIVSSHILTELSTICNTVGIIETGNLVASGNVQQILASLRTSREFTIKLLDAADGERAVALVENIKGVTSVETLGASLRVTIDATEPEIAQMARSLHEAGISFTEMREEQVDLETAFMTLTQGRLA